MPKSRGRKGKTAPPTKMQLDAQKAIEAQLKAFRQKIGRYPRPGEPPDLRPRRIRAHPVPSQQDGRRGGQGNAKVGHATLDCLRLREDGPSFDGIEPRFS